DRLAGLDEERDAVEPVRDRVLLDALDLLELGRDRALAVAAHHALHGHERDLAGLERRDALLAGALLGARAVLADDGLGERLVALAAALAALFLFRVALLAVAAAGLGRGLLVALLVVAAAAALLLGLLFSGLHIVRVDEGRGETERGRDEQRQQLDPHRV